uniref:Laminin, gamma 3 n=1 Tax=Anabas testudineus TaxID=64144 RepID=A0A7N6B8L0_ANATE
NSFNYSIQKSFAIYKRTEEDGPWVPYQYYSASCKKTYRKEAKGYIRPGDDDERTALCTDDAYNFDQSVLLQEWVTATDLLISLDRLNTFGDEFFKDAKVLRSYFYAISDFSVGGRCKCNGHASECVEGEHGGLVCSCQHHTVGADCQRCHPFYQDRPWARATGDSANECLKCNCSGRSDECVFDMEQYRSTGSGGRCVSCRDNTDGPHCERCRENHYRRSPEEPCLPCNCNIYGSVSLQCDVEGRCACRVGVTGEKCDTCRAGFHSLGPGGCRPCECDSSGSVDDCSPLDGRCHCRPNVEGQSCDRCKPGFFNLQQVNPAGCQPCFCFGHSLACSSSSHCAAVNITSDFTEGIVSASPAVNIKHLPTVFFYYRLHEQETRFNPSLSAFAFQHLLYNLTSMRINTSQLAGVTLTSAVISSSPANHPAPWVETCSCPLGFAGQFCEQCAPGFTRKVPGRGPLSACVPCNCHQHGSCHPETGVCECSDFTTGMTCEHCLDGYYGNALIGTPADCQPCPCPDRSSCAQIVETGQVVCTNCPTGQTGMRCQMCEDGYYGDPLGQSGAVQPCERCDCNGNVDFNALGICDHITGRCLKCLGYTEGDHCQYCQQGFYGNALNQTAGQKCKPCSCNPAGTSGHVNDCHPQTGNCQCLRHVTGRDCSHCEAGFFNLQPGVGCERCKCNPIGSASPACHPVTGQCVCHAGVEGTLCDSCRVGFFGFSSRGCRACNCDPMGSISMQCHSNGTCQCRQGFVGYKCDKCELNYFHNRATHQCEECPVCYGLVKKRVSLKLVVRVCMRTVFLGHQNRTFLLSSHHDLLTKLIVTRLITFLSSLSSALSNVYLNKQQEASSSAHPITNIEHVKF